MSDDYEEHDASEFTKLRPTDETLEYMWHNKRLRRKVGPVKVEMPRAAEYFRKRYEKARPITCYLTMTDGAIDEWEMTLVVGPEKVELTDKVGQFPSDKIFAMLALIAL